MVGRCHACYDSFSGPWCDNCDTWPCECVVDSTDAKRHAGQTRNSAPNKAPPGITPFESAPGGLPTPGARLSK